MKGQTVKTLHLENTNDFKPTKTVYDKKTDNESAEAHFKQNSTIMTKPEVEFLTRFTYCQAMLFKSWVEASDQIAKKLPTIKKDSKNSIPALYIKICEETFTSLFKSSEYASNLGKMINASMSLIRNYSTVSEKNNTCFDEKSSNKNQDMKTK
jgi:hypothetical protein